jgi:uncharacterized protein YceH (UPF0502 family)
MEGRTADDIAEIVAQKLWPKIAGRLDTQSLLLSDMAQKITLYPEIIRSMEQRVDRYVDLIGQVVPWQDLAGFRQRRNDELETRIAELEARIAELERGNAD